MFKTGIHHKRQLTPAAMSGVFGRRKFVAMDLYEELDDLPPDTRNQIQTRLLGRFSLQNGTMKYTYSRRFGDFERLALAAVAREFPTDQPLRVHDIGVSDARTSCDFYEELTRLYSSRLDFLISDYAPYLYALHRAGSKNRVIVDESGAPLQIVMPPFVFNTIHPEHKLVYPLNQLLRWLAMALYARPLLKTKDGLEKKRITLLCHEARTHMKNAGNFHFEVYDIMAAPKGDFDVIRVMNVLNESYFQEDALKKGLENVRNSLKEGGLFITGSNVQQGTIVQGGVFKKTNGRFAKIENSGDGSSIERLILAA